jgi:hypothetical protein
MKPTKRDARASGKSGRPGAVAKVCDLCVDRLTGAGDFRRSNLFLKLIPAAKLPVDPGDLEFASKM